MSTEKVMSFGETIRQLRTEKRMPQRKVAAFLDVDTSLLAKYERNVRHPSREIIYKLASLFQVSKELLYSEALTDKIANQIVQENADSKLLVIAAKKVDYIKSNKII